MFRAQRLQQVQPTADHADNQHGGHNCGRADTQIPVQRQAYKCPAISPLPVFILVNAVTGHAGFVDVDRLAVVVSLEPCERAGCRVHEQDTR